MQQAATLLTRYLETGAGLRRLPVEDARDLLRQALDLAARKEGLRPPWSPRSDDPNVLDRLYETVQGWAATTFGPDPIPPRAVLVAWLDAEIQRAFAGLLRTVRVDEDASEAREALLKASISDITKHARALARNSPWMLTGGRPGSFRELLRDRIQGFVLYTLEEDAALIRQFQGDTRDQWRAFLAVSLRRYVVAEGRQLASVRRGGRVSFISTATVEGALALGEMDRGESPADAIIALADLRLVGKDLLSYAARGEREFDDIELFLRAMSGELWAEIAASNAGGLDREGVHKVIRRVRRFLGPRLAEMGKPAGGS